MAREIELLNVSRLRATPLIQTAGENTYFFGVWGKIEFPVTQDDQTYILTRRDIINWPGLSNDFYGNPFQAWCIWVANSITDPWNVSPGLRVRIPSRNTVDNTLAGITKDAE